MRPPKAITTLPNVVQRTIAEAEAIAHINTHQAMTPGHLGSHASGGGVAPVSHALKMPRIRKAAQQRLY